MEEFTDELRIQIFLDRLTFVATPTNTNDFPTPRISVLRGSLGTARHAAQPLPEPGR